LSITGGADDAGPSPSQPRAIVQNHQITTDPFTSSRSGHGQPVDAPAPDAPDMFRRSVFAPGKTLYREGDPALRSYMVQSGVVKLVTSLPNGRSRIVGLEGAGAVLGLSPPTERAARYDHSAVALEPVTSTWVSADALRELRGSGSDEYIELLEQSVARLAHAERWMAEILNEQAPRRIARLIRLLARLQGAADPDEVRLLTCQEIGEAVGVSTESASRILAEFKRSGLLSPMDSGGKWHYRLDRNAMEKMAFA
jgi:CRP-like cAMP-binding protein